MIWIMVFAWLNVSPPDKHEIETRITAAEFPAMASDWLRPVVSRSRNVRYFRQTDGSDLSFEVKFRIGSESWSVEFLEDGTFEEAERLISERDLPEMVVYHLDRRFRTWKATRIQARHQPDLRQPALAAWFRNPASPIGYEVEVEGRNGSEIGRFELTFDAEGTFVDERRIIEIPIDF
jgi:hypothetical protein